MATDLNLFGVTRLTAGRFAMAWLVYGLCEAFAVSVQPGVSAFLGGDDPKLIWWVPALLLTIYTLWGLLFGALVGIILGLEAGLMQRLDRERLDDLMTVLAASGVALLFSINLILSFRQPGLAHVSRSGIASLAIAIGVIALWTLTARRPGFASLRAAFHPYGAVVLLVGLFWLTGDYMGFHADTTSSLAAKGIASLALIGTVMTGSWVIHHPGRSGGARLGRRTSSLMAALTVAMAVLCVLIDYGSFSAIPDSDETGAGKSGVPVILIVLDTVRADHLSLYGYHRKTDPNLARLAEAAVLYSHAIMPGNMTLSSHASMFTGRHVTRHGANSGTGRLPAGSRTLAEILQESGYTTAAVVSNCGWLGAGHGLDQGFQYYDARCGRSPFRAVRPFYLREPLRSYVRRQFFRERASWSWRDAGEITDESMSLLNWLNGGGSGFLLFVNYMDAHRPLHPPEPYDTLFPGKSRDFDMQRDWSELRRQVRLGKRLASKREREHLISQYDGAMAYMDDQIGRLFEHLRSLGLYEQSLIIVTSDHGEAFGERAHGERATFAHGDSLYQDAIAVPLLIKYPFQKRAEARGERVSGVDILPTILDVVDLPPMPEIGGESVAAALKMDRELLSESFDKKDRLQARAVFSASQKLIANRDGTVELYDLGRDPTEVADLAHEQPLRAEVLNTRLMTFVAQLSSTAALEDHLSDETAPLSPEEVKRLQSLGYLN